VEELKKQLAKEREEELKEAEQNTIEDRD